MSDAAPNADLVGDLSTPAASEPTPSAPPAAAPPVAVSSIDALEAKIAGAASAAVADVKAEVGKVEAKVRKYIPTTGQQIRRFLAAVQSGMVNAHAATEDEVDAHLASKGIS